MADTDIKDGVNGERKPDDAAPVKKKAARKKATKKKVAKKRVAKKRQAATRKSPVKKRAATANPIENKEITPTRADTQPAASIHSTKSSSAQLSDSGVAQPPVSGGQSGKSTAAKEAGIVAGEASQSTTTASATGAMGFWPKAIIWLIIIIAGFMYIRYLANLSGPTPAPAQETTTSAPAATTMLPAEAAPLSETQTEPAVVEVEVIEVETVVVEAPAPATDATEAVTAPPAAVEKNALVNSDRADASGSTTLEHGRQQETTATAITSEPAAAAAPAVAAETETETVGAAGMTETPGAVAASPTAVVAESPVPLPAEVPDSTVVGTTVVEEVIVVTPPVPADPSSAATTAEGEAGIEVAGEVDAAAAQEMADKAQSQAGIMAARREAMRSRRQAFRDRFGYQRPVPAASQKSSSGDTGASGTSPADPSSGATGNAMFPPMRPHGYRIAPAGYGYPRPPHGRYGNPAYYPGAGYAPGYPGSGYAPQ